MSRELYNPVAPSNSDARSVPGPIRSTSSRRITELPTVDRSPSRDYPTRRSPSGKLIQIFLYLYCQKIR